MSVLITADAARGMRPGSVIVDLAAEAGGNCELTKPGETVVEGGVTVVGELNLPTEVVSSEFLTMEGKKFSSS